MQKQRYLFLMLGVPGSGKSEFSWQLAKEIGAVYFNGDRFREAIFGDKVADSYNPQGHAMVFGAMREAMQQTLHANSVIYDANNNRFWQRSQDTALAQTCGAEAVVIFVQTPLAEAARRASARKVGGHSVIVTEDTVHRMHRALELPKSSEKSIIIDGTVEFAKQYAEFQSQLEAIHADRS